MNNDAEIRIGTKVDNSGFEKGVKNLKKEAEQVDKEVTQIMSKSASSTNKFGNAIGGVAKKAVSLGSALFDVVAVGAGLGALGIGAFILGKAFDKANGKTEQLKANLSYIGFVASKIFENLLQPAIDKTTGAVNGLVGALYKAVVYIGYILSKWTGKDLFAGTDTKSYAKSMEDANKSAKKTAKSTKQIKKDLMGFDEVNKLSDNTPTSTGGGSGTKVTMPNLPNLGDVKIPKWVEWIADHKDIILKVAGAILALLTFSKVVSWLAPLGNFFSMFLGGNGSSINSNLGGVLTKLGIIAGSIGVIAYANKNAKEQMKQTAEINERINKKGLEYNKEFVEGTEDLNKLNKDLNYRRQQGNSLLKDAVWYGSNDLKFTKLSKDAKKEYVKTLNTNLQQQDNILKKEMDLYRQGKLTDDQKKTLIEKLKSQKSYLNEIYDGYEEIGESTKEINKYTSTYNGYLEEMGYDVNAVTKAWDNMFPHLGKNKSKTNEIKSDTKTIGDNILGGAKALENFNKQKINDKTAKINVEANTSKANNTLSTFVSGLATKISNAFKKIDLTGFKDSIANVFKKIFPDVKLPNIKKILGLRQGGIINVPGRGVALSGNIIGGEAGPEAVLPLDDKTMDRLGSSIARHMNINLTNVTQMNGRTIGRELKNIMNENDFTYNG